MRKETTVCPLCRFIHKIDASAKGTELKCSNCNRVFVARTSRKGLQLIESHEDEINKTGGRVDLVFWNPAQSVFWIIEPKQQDPKQENKQ